MYKIQSVNTNIILTFKKKQKPLHCESIIKIDADTITVKSTLQLQKKNYSTITVILLDALETVSIYDKNEHNLNSIKTKKKLNKLYEQP